MTWYDEFKKMMKSASRLYYMEFGEPLPKNLERDQWGVPVHPFWRYFHYQKLIHIGFPVPEILSDEYLDVPCPWNKVFGYFFRISDYYWRMGVDLRKYRCIESGTKFTIPLPGPDIVPVDDDGLPYETYWLFYAVSRRINSEYPIPLYDRKGIPLNSFERDKQKELNQDEEYLKSWNYNPEPFNRDAFLKVFRAGNGFFGIFIIDDKYIDDQIPYLDDVDLYMETTPFFTYEQMCKEREPYFVPLFTPTVPDLAVAYVTLKNNPDAVLDDRRFPHGFTELHRAWLIRAANPSTIEYLQLHAGSGDEVLTEILLKNKKQLPNSSYYLL